MRHILFGLTVLVACAGPLCAETGVSLADYLDRLNSDGLRIIYSSDLVTESMRLSSEPAGANPRERLANALAQFGLALQPGPSGSLLVVPGEPDAGPDQLPPAESPPPEPITEIVVTSSLHRLEYAQPVTHTYLNRNLATRIPTVAEEAVRLTDRLPGTANGGVSTRNHVRGGEANEVLFLLDGLRLYEPYHMKDFQAIATIVNAGAIDGIDFFTGAFPARYGDRMSGVMSIDLRQPEQEIATELSLSFFNASALSIGTFGTADQGDWLVSARRGNLDLIVDLIEPEYGSPDYHDLLGKIGWTFGPRATLAANVLYSKDKLSLFDNDRGERATAGYKNEVLWLKWLAAWSDELSSETIAAYSDITNRRSGSVELPGIVSGSIADDREFSVVELRQDWRWAPVSAWLLRAGINLKRLDARYRLQSQKLVASPFDEILGNQPEVLLDYALTPSGAQYAAYLEARSRVADRIVLEAGLRWDQQTYTTSADDTQVSPRIALLIDVGSDTALRIGWGRYYQAEEINELQLSDGVADYFPAQRAEHLVLSFDTAFRNGLQLDISAYRKRFGNLRPRFENAFNSLTLVPELQFDRVRVDATAAAASGAEMTLSMGTADESYLWWLGYTWSRVEDDTQAGDVPRSWDQAHTVKAGLSWHWGSWDFSSAAEYHSGWPRTEMTGALGGGELILDVGLPNAAEFAPFHTLDIRISRNLVLTRGTLTAFLEVSNLYNRQNPCCTEYSLAADGNLAAAPRNWLPLVPSLGVVWRF